MAMGTRQQRQRQEELWVATATLACPASHPFYERLNRLLDECQFDEFVESLCKPFYAETLGRHGLVPGIYFRLLMVGYFEGIDSERGIAWRAADSLGIRKFLRIALDESAPDHSTISRTRRLIDEETHRLVFVWLLEILAERGLLRGHTIGIDATTLEANAALRTIVRRDTGEQYEEFLRRLAQESGIETPTRAQLAKLDKKRVRKGSNEDWTHPHDLDARITKMKDGHTHLAHKAEHAVDMESGAVVAITVQPADAGDTHSVQQTLAEAQENIAVVAEVIESEPDAPAVKVESPAELVTDKGYHSREVVRQVSEAGIRTYISEPERGRQRWRDQSAEQAAVYGNRRRVRGERGKRLQRQRGEKLERTMAHLYETGRMRRVHLRGHSNIIKRLLIHACGLNLGLLMRNLYGVGTPRGLQNGGFNHVFAFLFMLDWSLIMESEEIATLEVTSGQDETSICHPASCPHTSAWFSNFLNSLISASGC
jgi:transposase